MAKQERDPDNVDSSSCPIQAVVALLASPGEDGRDRGRFTTDLQEKACGLGRFPFDGAAFLRSVFQADLAESVLAGGRNRSFRRGAFVDPSCSWLGLLAFQPYLWVRCNLPSRS